MLRGSKRISCTSKSATYKGPTCRRQRLTDRFKPIEGCDGDCFSCARGIQIPTCGRITLAETWALTFSDYLRLKPDLKLFDLKQRIKTNIPSSELNSM